MHAKRECLYTLGNLLGTVTNLDFSGDRNLIIKRYLRMRVPVNTSSNLLPGCFQIKEDNSLSWLQFRYEIVADVCFKYGSFLHKDITCAETQKTFHFDNDTKTPALGPLTLIKKLMSYPFFKNKFIVLNSNLDFQSTKLLSLLSPYQTVTTLLATFNWLLVIIALQLFLWMQVFLHKEGESHPLIQAFDHLEDTL